MATSNEVVTHITGPGNSSPDGGVSEMRRTDPAGVQSDLPGVGGLSGVRSGDPDRKPQEVSSKSQTVGKRAVKTHRTLDFKNLNLEEKIGVLNALKKVRNKAPKVRDPAISNLFVQLYTAWIDETILKIIQPGASSESSFTTQEAHALKILAQTIIQRQNSPAQGVPAPPPPAATTSVPAQPLHRQDENPYAYRAAPMVPRPGLNPGVNTNAFREAQANFLAELDKMDREDPDSKWRNR